MLKREERVIRAFINCVKSNEYTFAYACILIEDQSGYGWLSDEAKEKFYLEFEQQEVEENMTDVVEENTIDTIDNTAEETKEEG